ncbi:MAG: hypothetical protein RM022_027535 [Nostoc sp. EfeVER01]|uniref:hypothetical protein n=1 Tax=unclassified Nostoc TaxID=2593658 RepID=UPI002AD29CAA|nr:hypothetical protein [Nostoc sp. EspVER01]MDZ7994714.1 hypothetical protein [Nostoc sp. EspVER01]
MKYVNKQVYHLIFNCHSEPSNVMKFWAACKLSEGDYLQVKEKLFAPETVASLYAKIKEYQDNETLL